MAKKSVKKIIEERGGAIAVAAALSPPGLKMNKTTVRSWCDNNKIPWWREAAVMALPVVPKASRRKAGDTQQAAA